MNSPFLAGFLIVVVVGLTGLALSNWSWSKPLAAAGTIALAIATLVGLALR